MFISTFMHISSYCDIVQVHNTFMLIGSLKVPCERSQPILAKKCFLRKVLRELHVRSANSVMKIKSGLQMGLMLLE